MQGHIGGDVNTHITYMYICMCMHMCYISMYTFRYVYSQTNESVYITRHLYMYIHTHYIHACLHTFVYIMDVYILQL